MAAADEAVGTMSAQHPNATFLAQTYDAWGAAEEVTIDDLRKECTDDYTWHIAGSHRISGDHVGLEAVRDVLRTMQKHMEENPDSGFCMSYEGVFANDVWGLVITGSSATVDGEELSYRVFDIFRFQAPKLLAESWTFADPQAYSDRVWS